MAADTITSLPTPGFKFDNCLRNAYLTSKGFPVPKARKTGTTIVGMVFKDGVILGADTRATSGAIVADKNCTKIHYMAPNMYCCGAGTAADTEQVTNMVASQLELHRLATDRVVPVCVANRLLYQYLFRYQGNVGAALILGGVDAKGPHIFSIHPHGSYQRAPFDCMGSGSLAAIAVFEKGWKPDMELEDGKRLVRDAIAAGIFNDLGSGSRVDMCIITKDKVDYIRPYEISNDKGQILGKYLYPPGTTPILSTRTIPLEVEDTTVKRNDEAMDVEL